MSEKLDGVRVLFFGGVAYSRSLKLLPNQELQFLAQEYAEELEGCDGEVIAGDLYAKDVLQQSVSFAMSADSKADFKVYLFDRFDHINLDKPWLSRFSTLNNIVHGACGDNNVEVLQHFEANNPKELDKFESQVLARGGEGVMLRNTVGKYKCGRSGTKTPELQKVKRFQDTEFTIVGYEQFYHNNNEATVNELGRTTRSTSKEGLVAVDTLGSLICSLGGDKTFNVGTGYTQEQRSLLWAMKDSLPGKLAKIKFFHYSADGVPLLPVFLALRDERDI
jgi:DNA ligase-1